MPIMSTWCIGENFAVRYFGKGHDGIVIKREWDLTTNLQFSIWPYCICKHLSKHQSSVSLHLYFIENGKEILMNIRTNPVCRQLLFTGWQNSHCCNVRSWLRDQWPLKQTPAGQQIIHTDHGIGGLLLTQQIGSLLIRQAQILRPLSSSIMKRMTEVGLHSEEGVPRDKDWKRNRLQRVN